MIQIICDRCGKPVTGKACAITTESLNITRMSDRFGNASVAIDPDGPATDLLLCEDCMREIAIPGALIKAAESKEDPDVEEIDETFEEPVKQQQPPRDKAKYLTAAVRELAEAILNKSPDRQAKLMAAITAAGGSPDMSAEAVSRVYAAVSQKTQELAASRALFKDGTGLAQLTGFTADAVRKAAE